MMVAFSAQELSGGFKQKIELMRWGGIWETGMRRERKHS